MAGQGLGARGEVTPHKITDRERRARALTLRKSGQGYQQIADTIVCRSCGHNPHGGGSGACSSEFCSCTSNDPGRLYSREEAARRAVKTALKEITTVPATELLQLELERLDTLQQAAWVRALKGNVEAYRNVLRTMERRAKYLGLDDFDRRMARLEEAKGRADEKVVDQLQTLLMGVLGRLDLPPDAQYLAPQIMAEELDRLGYAQHEEDD